MPKCDFNKVAKQSNFIEIALWHGCPPVNLMHIFRTLFLGRLLLFHLNSFESDFNININFI